ncbi:sigma-54-dependent transcriptional regulator [Mucilaginibacter lappiensis]|uniref:Two-component system NtrC family response regulator n=1 Tax=Mucilaginibacter lappiensis TaxID=354630 RepID=A0A841JE09_9SPHI|nr:sigma-54 dependent transcriptional regulator [Mucilaginibacter lappiensis]MBB6109991.1 two-component system NtrC family response regulator [Mucilaginibacter lappiensis]MBB6126705.1 two-component system NtrC family response regulator [Mucilaginibacter lappiensis]
MTIANVLLVEDENDVRLLLKRVLSLEGFVVYEAENIKTASKLLANENIDLVLCDVKLPDGNGVEFISKIKAAFPYVEIIVLTAYGNIPDSVQAIKNGAFDYITKANDNQRILPLLYRALEKVKLEKRVAQLEKQAADRYANFDSIIGKSLSITQAKTLAQMAAPTDAPVLLLGETGAGKEVFAQAIHSASKRNMKTFLGLNCSAFGKDILESELFGHKAGAFTGANKDKKGLIEEANEGTLFLDEIGEMPLDLQAKLLRVLETSEFIKVGDTKQLKVNIRVIAATNRDIQQDISNGKFREDLFYRLNLVTINLPSLRERQDDIPLLAEYFVKKLTRDAYQQVKGMTNAFVDRLQKNEWRGNIRELRNVIERSLIVCRGTELSIDNLPVELQYHTTLKSNTLSAFDLSSVERLHIHRVLQYTKGNKTQAAKLLNISSATLYRKIDEYKIEESQS